MQVALVSELITASVLSTARRRPLFHVTDHTRRTAQSGHLLTQMIISLLSTTAANNDAPAIGYEYACSAGGGPPRGYNLCSFIGCVFNERRRN